MAKTETATYRFTVKEGQPSVSGARGAPVWLMLEPTSGELGVLRGGFLSLRMPASTDISRAQQVAAFLNDNIEGVSFTMLDSR